LKTLLAASHLARERPDLKPSLDAVMSQEQLEKKVADYLRKSPRWRLLATAAYC